MPARSVAILGLCGGSYLMGIATSLLLVEFSQFPDTWQHVTTLVLAALAVIILATSVASILQRDDVPDANPPGAGAVCASREESVTQTMPSASFRNEPYGAVRDPGFVEAGRNTGNREGPDAVAVVLPPSVEGGEVAGPQPGVLGDELRPPATEPAGTGEPPRAQEPQAADLIRVWDNYRRTGDGHFNAQGFQRQLDDQRLEATVLDSEHISVGDGVLAVETPSRKPEFYVLPSFAKSPRAVSDWFDDRSSGALTGRIERVLEIAEGRRTERGSIDTIRKGVVA